MFGKDPGPQATPTPPAAPANPPMYGANASKKKAGPGAPQQFNASALGTVPGPGGTGQKSLLGQ